MPDRLSSADRLAPLGGGCRARGGGWLVRLAVVAGCLLVASCWMPNQFLAEVRLARNGDYALIYDGVLIRIPLAQEIRSGSLSAAEIADKTRILERDLGRDSAFKEIRPRGDGGFDVRYERLGHLGTRDVFAFVRRNEAIITIETFEDGRAVIRGRGLGATERAQLTEAGLTMQGRLRVVTDALPLRGNAQAVRRRGFQRFLVYDWTLSSVNDPVPYLEVDLSRPPPDSLR